MADSWGGAGSFSGRYQSVDTNPFSDSNMSASHSSVRVSSGTYTDDEYSEAHNLVFENIKRLAQLFNQISAMAKAVGTPKDSTRHRTQMTKLIDDTQALARQTRQTISEMASLIQTSSHGVNRAERRASVEKLTQDFGRFMNQFEELCKVAVRKQREQPLPGQGAITSASGAGNPGRWNAQAVEDPLDNAFRDETRERRAQQQQLDDEREFQDALIRERDEEIRSIQSQMIQVNDVFRDLARLVEDQGEQIDNIQSNMVSASQHVTEGHEEIVKAAEYQDSSRRTLCYLAIGIVVVVGIAVLIVVLLSQPKKH